MGLCNQRSVFVAVDPDWFRLGLCCHCYAVSWHRLGIVLLVRTGWGLVIGYIRLHWVRNLGVSYVRLGVLPLVTLG